MISVPRTRNEIVPFSVLPAVPRGVRYTHVAVPFLAPPLPRTLSAPTVAVQRTAVGRTDAPPARARTVAATVEPALGRLGAMLTALAETCGRVGGGGAVGGATVTRKVTLLFVRSGSVSVGVTDALIS